MNIDLFKKLVRLANNNPNENEANLAARKACRMIEDAEFKFVDDKLPFQSSQKQQDFYNRTSKDIYEDLRNMMKDFSNLKYGASKRCNKCGKEFKSTLNQSLCSFCYMTGF